MTMIEVRLTGGYDGDKRAALNALYRGLDAPWWSAFNLDAAWDILTTDIAGPITITWVDRIGQEPLAALLSDAANERPDLTVLFSDSNGTTAG